MSKLITENVSITVAGKPVDAYCARPESLTPDTRAIIVISEIFGVKGHIQSICQRLSAEGYYAIAPDLFHRFGRNLKFDYNAYEDIKPLLAKLTNDMLLEDVKATKEFIKQIPELKAATIGLIGFCLGGFTAFLAATKNLCEFTVGFYGGGIVKLREGIGLTPPINDAAEIKIPMCLFFGDEDTSIPQEQVKAIDYALAYNKVDYTLQVFEGGQHGFMNHERTSFYNEGHAQTAWTQMIAWLKSKGFHS